MSRIGKLPVVVPAGVIVTVNGAVAEVNGPKGKLTVGLPKTVKIEQSDGRLVVKPGKGPDSAALYGLSRTLLYDAVVGVTEGFSKNLEIHGVGYRAQLAGQKLTLNLGLSHPIEYSLPEGIEATVEGNLIIVKGISKQLVGQVAAEIRSFRKPEPYKGKGIRYQGEPVRRKAGKAAAAAGGAKS